MTVRCDCVPEPKAAVHAAAPDTTDLLVIGGSIAASFPSDLIMGAFPGLSVWNADIGGDMIQNVLWRLPHLATEIKPPHVILIVGTNNIMAGDKPCDIAAGVANLLDNMDRVWDHPKVTYLGVPPQLSEDTESAIAEANRLMHPLARFNRTIFDMAELRNRRENYEPDDIHLALDGYQMLTSVLQQSASVTPPNSAPP